MNSRQVKSGIGKLHIERSGNRRDAQPPDRGGQSQSGENQRRPDLAAPPAVKDPHREAKEDERKRGTQGIPGREKPGDKWTHAS